MKRYVVRFWANKTFLTYVLVTAKNKRFAKKLARTETGYLKKVSYKATADEV